MIAIGRRSQIMVNGKLDMKIEREVNPTSGELEMRMIMGDIVATRFFQRG